MLKKMRWPNLLNQWNFGPITIIVTNTAVGAGSSRQGVGTVHASSNFAASHHYESYITCVPQDWLPAGFTGPGSD